MAHGDSPDSPVGVEVVDELGVGKPEEALLRCDGLAVFGEGEKGKPGEALPPGDGVAVVTAGESILASPVRGDAPVSVSRP